MEAITGQATMLAASELAACEAVIERGLSSFIETGQALKDIKQDHLYRTIAPTFEEYLARRWPDLGGRAYANRVIAAAETVKQLAPIGAILPATETQARPLTSLTPAQQTVAWRRVLEKATTTDKEITAALVEIAVEELRTEERSRREAADAARAAGDEAAEAEERERLAWEAAQEQADADLTAAIAVDEEPEDDGYPPVLAEEPDDAAAPATPPAQSDQPRLPLAKFFTVAEWQHLPAPVRRGLLAERASSATTAFNRTNDNVEWALWTWNPVTGCDHGCPYCYARDIAVRHYGPNGFAPANAPFTPVIHPGRLHAPRHMKVPAAARENVGEQNVFVCSMADLFGKWVPQDWIDAVFAEVVRAAAWNFLFLTKFPQRLAEQDWPANAWVGTTVDTQARVANAQRSFDGVEAGVKWLSCEPLLERLTFDSLAMFDWVVIGGQSRSSQTPEFQPPWEWVEHLLTQARAAGCQVYMKPNLKARPREYPGAGLAGLAEVTS